MQEIGEEIEPISRIREGTVIDHIPATKATAIWFLLDLEKHKKRIYVGLNLHSTQMHKKDLIKIEERELLPEEANRIAIFAPDATISLISEGEVREKYQVSLPETIEGHFHCPNSKCISNHEIGESRFTLINQGSNTQLRCHFCRTIFTQDDISL